jgi:hypothetical protein
MFLLQVERTKKRPLASGVLTLSQGLYFLVFEVLLWFGFLLQLNKYRYRSIILFFILLVRIRTHAVPTTMDSVFFRRIEPTLKIWSANYLCSKVSRNVPCGPNYRAHLAGLLYGSGCSSWKNLVKGFSRRSHFPVKKNRSVTPLKTALAPLEVIFSSHFSFHFS